MANRTESKIEQPKLPHWERVPLILALALLSWIVIITIARMIFW